MAKTAVANTETEAVKGGRNFRNSPDIENFYRFVHENDLRKEAKAALELVVATIKPKKKRKRRTKKIQ